MNAERDSHVNIVDVDLLSTVIFYSIVSAKRTSEWQDIRPTSGRDTASGRVLVTDVHAAEEDLEIGGTRKHSNPSM